MDCMGWVSLSYPATRITHISVNMDIKEELIKLKKDALEDVKKIVDPDAYKELYAKYLGRKGELARLAKGMKNIAESERPSVGILVNDVKMALESALEDAKNTILGSFPDTGDSVFDITLPGNKVNVGGLHPITSFIWEIEDTFRELGFGVVDGPEVESEWYNFDALNAPSWHPSRDMQDTFHVKTDKEEKMVMRTQTSPVQIRAMETYGAPIKIIVPGRVYRNEEMDARHEATFWQVEGLVVDKGISISHLLGTMNYFIDRILGAKTRWRPGYFPFVEPGLEMDIECLLCSDGCRVCKGTGWLEFMGAGMVHPNVLKSAGVDSNVYSGFAFGFGPERLHMLKYGVNDVRLYKSGDLRFLEQF